MTPKRCICRKSSRFPICDGSHTTQSWCKPNKHSDVSTVSTVVICSPSLTPLGEWWANHVQGLLRSRYRLGLLFNLFRGINILCLRNGIGAWPQQTDRTDFYWHIETTGTYSTSEYGFCCTNSESNALVVSFPNGTSPMSKGVVQKRPKMIYNGILIFDQNGISSEYTKIRM